MAFDLTQLRKFPEAPGVYIMKDRKDMILYVGKSTNLRQGVRQYFTIGSDGRARIPRLVARIENIETIVVPTEKEALLLERTLIRKHKPKYNTFLREDKSYICLRIDVKDLWPRVSLVRSQGGFEDDALYFGPYVSAYDARQVLDLLNEVFPLRQCSREEMRARKRPCILFQMKRCLAPCVGECSKKEYSGVVDGLVSFMEGKDRTVVRELHSKMKKTSDNMEFEHAGEILKTIRSLKRVFEAQRVENIEYGDTDVLAVFRYSVLVVVSRIIFKKGRLSGVNNYSFSGVVQSNSQILQSFIMQCYAKSKNVIKDVPREILLSEDINDSVIIADILGKAVRITVPRGGEKRDLVEVAYSNACASIERQKDAKVITEKSLMEMQERLKLVNYPRRIECFDTSHISGKSPVAVMVSFIDGEKSTGRHRKYQVSAENVSGDYKAMQEALARRYKRASLENDFPDLIIVDGGRVHLNIVKRVLEDIDISAIDVVAVAKEHGRHDKGTIKEQIYISGAIVPIILKDNSPLLFLIQRIRDESHRVTIDFHRKSCDKNVLTRELENLIGIGIKKRNNILRYFGSVRCLKEATDEEMNNVEGLTKTDIEMLIRFKKAIKKEC